MVSSSLWLRGILVFCSFSIFLLSGCTAQEEKEFNDALRRALIQEARNQVNNATNNLVQGAEHALGIGGECRFDSDCTAMCEGSVYWKRGCDPRTDKCMKTFDTDCHAQTTVVGNYDFAKLCAASGCADDTASIHAKKEELIAQANEYTAAMQQTTALRQTAAKNCIGALADVTDKLIIDTALTFGRLPTSTTSIYSITTKQTINTLGGAATGGTRMSAEEFISLNCNAVKALDTDFALASKKRDIVMEEAKAFEGR